MRVHDIRREEWHGKTPCQITVMGSQFWWFYDVLAAAAILVMIYLSGRRGVFKSVLHLAGYFLAFVLAFSISGSAAKGIYKNSVRNSNIKKLTKSVVSTDFIAEVKDHIEDDYDFSGEVDYERIEKIYTEEDNLGFSYDEQLYQYVSGIYANKIGDEKNFYQKLHKSYADIISGIVSENLVAYAGESAYQVIIQNPDKMDELIPLILAPHSSRSAAEYIADSCTDTPYMNIIRLISFMAILAVLIAATAVMVHITFRTAGFQSLGSHIGGGAAGVLLGAVIVVFIAACVRLNVICGENKMLFFNNEAIDRTYLFRHFYSFITSNL